MVSRLELSNDEREMCVQELKAIKKNQKMSLFPLELWLNVLIAREISL